MPSATIQRQAVTAKPQAKQHTFIYKPIKSPIDIPVGIDVWQLVLAEGLHPRNFHCCGKQKLIIIGDSGSQNRNMEWFWLALTKATRCYIKSGHHKSSPPPVRVVHTMMMCWNAAVFQQVETYLSPAEPSLREKMAARFGRAVA